MSLKEGARTILEARLDAAVVEVEANFEVAHARGEGLLPHVAAAAYIRAFSPGMDDRAELEPVLGKRALDAWEARVARDLEALITSSLERMDLLRDPAGYCRELGERSIPVILEEVPADELAEDSDPEDQEEPDPEDGNADQDPFGDFIE